MIALYLWVVLALFAVHKSVILAETRLDFASQTFALINALALAKVMLVAKELHLGDRAKDEPLIYPTLLKSALFSVLLACFKILEEAAVGLYRGKSFSQSIAEIGGGTLKGIISLTAIMFVMLIPFFAFTELQRVLGEGKLSQLFFRRRETLNLLDHSVAAGARSVGQDNLGKGASA